MNKNQTYTPMITQYLKIKEDYADALVFFRLGDFYELFFDDAITASKELEITLTKRDAGSKIPMAGVPHHAAKPYIAKLIQRGYKIAIAEQVSEPGAGLVERKVVRLITPGTVFEDDILDSKTNNYIASLILRETGYLLTYVDISTGEAFIIKDLTRAAAIDYLTKLKIKELILTNASDESLIEELKNCGVYISIHAEFNNYDHKWSDSLTNELKTGPRHLMNYLQTTQDLPLFHFKKIEEIPLANYVKVDNKVKNHLEIIDSNTNNFKTTLLNQIDNTNTAMGSRLLKHHLNHPVFDSETLNKRFDLNEAFSNVLYRSDLINALNDIYDINRIVSKLVFKSVNPRDLIQLKITLLALTNLKAILTNFNNSLINELVTKIDDHKTLYNLLDEAILEEPPISFKEGDVIKPEYNEQLNYLVNLNESSEQWLKDFEEQEKERLDTKNLKVGYNRNFGYYIEISKAQSMLLEDNHGYERRQTLTNSERYISPELKQKEEEILTAKEKAINLELQLFNEISEEILKYTTSLQNLSSLIALIDVHLSHQITAEKNNYVRLEININSRQVDIKDARHPVVEKFTKYVSNDIIMRPSEIFLITGPNMSGKSTYMRMFALIIYMMQVGSFVPASSAKLPLYDAIYTRIGSSDDLAGGKSTFMVEMVESNEALTFATANSIILFDEIGRGTATYDGIALAQGMIEYIATKIKAQTLFSTHYHELTKLSDLYSNITNLHVRASEEDGKMIFLHQVEKGATSKSYGLQVAALANLPSQLLKRSQVILDELEKNKSEIKIDLFNYNLEEVKVERNFEHEEMIKDLKEVNLDELTPIEALIYLKNMQNKIK